LERALYPRLENFSRGMRNLEFYEFASGCYFLESAVLRDTFPVGRGLAGPQFRLLQEGK
jgi:hypothetical protein